MLSDTLLGLAMAIVVISSVAWVTQFRRIRATINLRRTMREQRTAAKPAH